MSETRLPLRDAERDLNYREVNYYVVVPFTTLQAAEWAWGEIDPEFDCFVIGAAAVERDTPLEYVPAREALGA